MTGADSSATESYAGCASDCDATTLAYYAWDLGCSYDGCVNTDTVCDTDGNCDDILGSLDGYGCELYIFNPQSCGMADDDDFTADDLCCACGGGSSTPYPTLAPTLTTLPIPVPTAAPGDPTAPPVPAPTSLLTSAPTVLLAPTVATSQTYCGSTDHGATDTSGNGCNDYYASLCGISDDDDFTSEDMCCVCGGGDSSTGSMDDYADEDDDGSYFSYSYADICADSSLYLPDASSTLSGCEAGSSVCDSDGYWYCSDVIDLLVTGGGYTDPVYSSPFSACSADIVNEQSFSYSYFPISEELYTQLVGVQCCSDGISVCGAFPYGSYSYIYSYSYGGDCTMSCPNTPSTCDEFNSMAGWDESSTDSYAGCASGCDDEFLEELSSMLCSSSYSYSYSYSYDGCGATCPFDPTTCDELTSMSGADSTATDSYAGCASDCDDDILEYLSSMLCSSYSYSYDDDDMGGRRLGSEDRHGPSTTGRHLLTDVESMDRWRNRRRSFPDLFERLGRRSRRRLDGDDDGRRLTGYYYSAGYYSGYDDTGYSSGYDSGSSSGYYEWCPMPVPVPTTATWAPTLTSKPSSVPTPAPTREPRVQVSMGMSGMSCSDFVECVLVAAMDEVITDSTVDNAVCTDADDDSVTVDFEVVMARSAFLSDADDGMTLFSYAMTLLQAAVTDGTLTSEINSAASSGCGRRLSPNVAQKSGSRLFAWFAGREGRALSMSDASVDSVSVSTHSPTPSPTPTPTMSPTPRPTYLQTPAPSPFPTSLPTATPLSDIPPYRY